MIEGRGQWRRLFLCRTALVSGDFRFWSDWRRCRLPQLWITAAVATGNKDQIRRPEEFSTPIFLSRRWTKIALARSMAADVPRGEGGISRRLKLGPRARVFTPKPMTLPSQLLIGSVSVTGSHCSHSLPRMYRVWSAYVLISTDSSFGVVFCFVLFCFAGVVGCFSVNGFGFG